MYTFGKARTTYAQDIVTTTQYYYNRFNEKIGFLAGFRTAEQVKKQIENYYVVKDTGAYAGHVHISFKLPDEFEQLDWYNNKEYLMLKNAKNVIYIQHIAIKKEYAGKGCGKYLLNRLFYKFNQHLILSSVIVKPYCNEYSYMFHKKCGFYVVAYYNNDVIGKMHFESIYMLKGTAN